MANRPTLSCADCGNPMWTGRGCLPQGQARCRPCRKANPVHAPKKPYIPKPAWEWDCIVCGAHVVGTSRSHTGKKCDEHRLWKPHACNTCGQQVYSRWQRQAYYCSDACGTYPPPPALAPPKPRAKPNPWAAPASGKLVSDLNWRQCQHCNGWMCKPGCVYCGKSCSAAAKLIKDRNNRRKRYPPTPATCIHCAASITIGRRTCDDCSARLKQSRKGKHRARARRFGVEYESVNALAVYSRDGWRCGICEKPVDRRLAWPDQMCASLDHVVPMSRGGPHTYGNTQCAHWLCNTLKSDACPHLP